MSASLEQDLEHLRGWIGRSEQASETLSPELVDRFNATFDLGGRPARPGDVAPLLVQFCLAQPASRTADLAGDGHPRRGGFLPPVPLPRRMWAGGRLQFLRDLKVGDLVTRRSRIEDVSLKTGKSGGLCFVTVAHSYASGGDPVVQEIQTLVYRSPAGGGSGAPQESPALRGDHVERVEPTPPLLFRYSALTFNGHRIHYDHPYATGVEGYPGLVVHGPLQATLLIQFAERLLGSPPRSFVFRSVSPLFDDQPFELHATREGDAVRLWTARLGGPVAMQAEASA